MKQIPLTQGKFALVDDVDFDYLNQWNWYFNNGYAVRGNWNQNKRKMDMILMHREILKTPKKFETDHKNRNRLDNRRKNLRIANASTNQANRILSNNTSGYKGVSYKKTRNKWEASITFMGKYIYIGQFFNKKDAALAYNQVAKKYFEEFAWLNKI